MTPTIASGVRGTAGLLLVAYTAAVAVVLLNADQELPTRVIAEAESALEARGAPGWLTAGARVQMALNALMFAPLAALASIAWPRWAWGNWVALAFIGSGSVEVFQAFALEPRSAEYVDVVANTLGALVGVVVVIPLTMSLRRAARGSANAS